MKKAEIITELKAKQSECILALEEALSLADASGELDKYLPLAQHYKDLVDISFMRSILAVEGKDLDSEVVLRATPMMLVFPKPLQDANSEAINSSLNVALNFCETIYADTLRELID